MSTRRRPRVWFVAAAVLSALVAPVSAANARTPDPRLTWTRFAFSDVQPSTVHVAADRAGNLYLAADSVITSSGGKRATPGAYVATYEPWLLKMTPSGQVVWLRQLGGSGNDAIRDITVLSDGRVAAALFSTSPDFPGLGLTDKRPAAVDDSDGVVTVLDPADGQVLWSRALGGGGADEASSIAAGAGGSIVVGGSTVPTQNPYLPAADDPESRLYGPKQVPFAAVLNGDGTVRWFRPVLPRRAAPNGEYVTVNTGVAVGRSGQVVLTGYGVNAELPTTPGTVQPRMTREHGNQGFVFGLSPAGTLTWGSYLGGRGSTLPQAVEVADDGTVAVVGTTEAPDFPRLRALQPRCAAGDQVNGFVTRLAANARRLIQSTCLGGSGGGRAFDVTTARDGTLVVVGDSSGPGLPARGRCQNSRAGGAWDGFVLTFGRGGTALTRAFAFGGSGGDMASAVAAVSGGIAVAGATTSLDFPGAHPGDPDAPRQSAPGQPNLQSVFLTRFTGL